MSALWPHARAMRVLGEEIVRRADPLRGSPPYLVLLNLGQAHIDAASRLEAEIVGNAGRHESGAPLQANPDGSLLRPGERIVP